MKRFYLNLAFILLISFGFSIPARASYGIFESYVVVASTFYDLFATTSNPDFSGANLGSFTTGGTLLLNGGEIKTFKTSRSGCSNGNVCGGTLSWAVKLSGATVKSGSFTLNYNSAYGDQNSGACSVNQKWDFTSGSQNILSGLSAGSYTLQVFCAATGSQSNTSSCSDNVTQAALSATFTVNAPLAVQLLSFTAEKSNKDVFLNWATASETDNQYFQVEHQTAGQDWSVLGRINSKGNASASQAYRFTHHNPANGLHYYRLQQVDLNGKSTYSPITSIDFQSYTQIVLSPNPLRGDQLSIRLPDAETPHQLRLFNLQGQLLKSWSIEAGVALWHSLDVSGVPAGLLFLQMDGEIPLQLIKS
ncbi:MAG: T9SS type A sorting domain-containing protein [Bacteroidota bacterium]